MPWRIVSGAGRWIGGRAAHTKPEYTFNRSLGLALAERRWVSHLHCNVFCFGTAGGLLFGKPPVFLPNISQLIWLGAKAKIGRACLGAFRKWTPWREKVGIFGAAFPQPQQVQRGNLSPMEWRSAKRTALGSKLAPEGCFCHFFPPGEIEDSCQGALHTGKHVPGLHNRRKQVPDGAPSLALQWAIVQRSHESLFVLE